MNDNGKDSVIHLPESILCVATGGPSREFF